MRRKKCLAVVFALICFAAAGCMGFNSKPKAAYKVGVVDSDNSGAGLTYIYLLDENLKNVDTLKCTYHVIGNYGSTPIQVLDGKAYLGSCGVMSRDRAVFSFDMQTGEWEKYPAKEMLDDFRVTEDGIFAVGNMNGITYISYYPAGRKELEVVEVENTAALGLAVKGMDVYFIGTNLTEETESIYHVNMQEKTWERKRDVTEELRDNLLGNTQWHENELYIPSSDCVVVYDPDQNDIRTISLPGKYAERILADRGKFFVMDCDSRNGGETEIYCINPETDEIEFSCRLEETVLQADLSDGILYTLEQEPIPTVRKYELSLDGTCTKIAEASIEEKEDSRHRISDMFLQEK